MHRIKLILLISQLSWFIGGITLYIQPSWLSFTVVVIGLSMRWMVPLPRKKKESEYSFTSLFAYIWTVSLMSWLNTQGMSEVIERALADRLSLAPLLLLSSLLCLVIVRDWTYLNNLSTQDIDLYYATGTEA